MRDHSRLLRSVTQRVQCEARSARSEMCASPLTSREWGRVGGGSVLHWFPGEFSQPRLGTLRNPGQSASLEGRVGSTRGRQLPLFLSRPPPSTLRSVIPARPDDDDDDCDDDEGDDDHDGRRRRQH
eukprot:9500662-Pyramimonas_sp.AAC.2